MNQHLIRIDLFIALIIISRQEVLSSNQTKRSVNFEGRLNGR